MKKDILICGFGVSGRGAARLALKLGRSVVLADEKDTPAMRDSAKEFTGAGAELLFGWHPGVPLPESETAVLSPGLRRSSALYQALPGGTERLSELEFALRLIPCPFAAVTGTNGKTTTTELATALLRAAGKRAAASGNVGNALSGCVADALDGKYDFMVIETSSFQLESIRRFPPCPAALLNIASDHIDRHGSLEAYARIKFGLLNSRAGAETRIMNSNLLGFRDRIRPGLTATTFSASDPEADFTFAPETGRFAFHGKTLFDFAETKLAGVHNAENILAALALLRATLGEDALFSENTRNALREFKSGAHRMEVFEERGGIRYVDDSKATNPHAVNAAVATFARGRNILLVLGGLDKGMDFSELEKSLPHVKRAFLAGSCAEKLASAVSPRTDAVLCGSFREAVERACAAARAGDCVMLSPATASMDMFRNYAERGDAFKKAVRDFLNGQASLP